MSRARTPSKTFASPVRIYTFTFLIFLTIRSNSETTADVCLGGAPDRPMLEPTGI